MTGRRIERADLAGKVIDCHSHLGVSLKAYARGEYPYAQTAEGLYYRQLSGGVDVNVVFPFSADLHFDLARLADGDMVPAGRPVSPVPYAAENRLLMREVFEFCPQVSGRFLPFVSVDPVRSVREQVAELSALERDHPVYGIKVNPVGCQSPVSGLLGAGRGLLDFAEERRVPLLFHATTLPGEEYSQASDVFRIIEARPRLRFCLAHCLLFHREFLERAAERGNVWVDTAAMKIQVEYVRGELGRSIPRERVIDADYSDHRSVMRALTERFPGTIVWGTDAPAYSYICRRKQGEGMWTEFRLSGAYEDELSALDALPAELRAAVSNRNTLDFIFGPDGAA